MQLLRRAGRLRVAVVGIAVLALAGVGVWWFLLRTPAASSAATPTTTTTTVAAALETLEQSVTATGTISPTVEEELSFEVSGTVTAVSVAVGQTVTAGQALATVDTLQVDANLLSAKATLATAEAELSNLEDEDDGSDASEAQIAAAAAQVEVAQAAVEEATEAVAGATLVAPVDGLVTSVALEVGQAVTGSGGSGSSSSASGGSAGGSTGMTGSTGSTGSTGTTSSAQVVIVGTESWDVDVTVDETDVALVAVGDQVEITPQDATETLFGTVSEIGLLSTASGGVATYPVTVAITGRPEGVYDGVTADVEIIYERRVDVLTVPTAAVRTVDGESTVTQLDADGAEVSTVVTVGQTVGDLTEIVDGLAEGDEVVVTQVVGGNQSGTGSEDGRSGFGELPEGFDPSQLGELPEGFDPSQMQGQMPQMPGGASND